MIYQSPKTAPSKNRANIGEKFCVRFYSTVHFIVIFKVSYTLMKHCKSKFQEGSPESLQKASPLQLAHWVICDENCGDDIYPS